MTDLMNDLKKINEIKDREERIQAKREWEKKCLEWGPESDHDWNEHNNMLNECPEWNKVMTNPPVDERQLHKMIRLAQLLNVMINDIFGEIADGAYDQS
jgi:hypothetical protein